MAARLARVIVALTAVASCNGEPPTTPTSSPTSTPTSLHTVTVTVVDRSNGISVPVPSAMIFFWYRRPDQSFATGSSARADANGRWEFRDAVKGTALKVRADKGALSQPCAMHLTVSEDASRSVELTAAGMPLGPMVSPIVSGQVYENTPAGRRPLEGYGIGYMEGCRGLVMVHGWTDANGRYSFCNLPRGSGCVVVFVPTDDWETVDRKESINIQGDHTLDIAIVR